MPLAKISVRTAFTLLSATAVVSVAAVALVGKPEPVQAFPAYTEKEGVKCAYCHIRQNGGGPRNYRGKYYKANGLSFAKFDDVAEAKASGEPIGPEADTKPKSWTPAAGDPPAVPEPSPSPVATPTPATGTAELATITKLRDKAAVTAAALKKSPSNAAAKKAHSAALTALARGIMADGSRKAEAKYPEALRLSRQAVALDPANKNAAADVKRITTVYKQMGRPLPK